MGTDITRHTQSYGEPEGEQPEKRHEQSSLDDAGRTDTEQEIEESVDDHAEERGITDRQGKTIEERREGVGEALEDELEIVESHQYGSHSRGTMTGPLDEDSDADIMFVLSDEERRRYMKGGDGARNVLRKVKRAIKRNPRYADMDVSIDRNVVAIKYHDMTMEVTPAFRDGSGGYHIPDTYQEGRSWVRTNPRQYKNMFQASNQARGGRPQKLARLAKDYNDRNGKPVSSYHMEVMAYQYARTQPRDTPTDELVDGFFERLPSKVRQGTKDPVYDTQRVDEGMDWETRREAVKKSRKARKHIRRAKKLKEQGKTEAAKEEYRKVLGEDFK
jgi:hypothetical protein